MSLPHLNPFPSLPQKDCRNRTIWCCPSPPLRLQMERWARNTLRMRRKEGNREKWGRKRLQKNCDLKRKLFMIMEYNKKKKCGSFCHFLFLFDVIIIVYFWGSIFPWWRSVSTYLFLGCCFCFCIVNCLIYSGCSHHSKWVLATTKKESAVLSQLVIPDPHSCPSPFLSQV